MAILVVFRFRFALQDDDHVIRLHCCLSGHFFAVTRGGMQEQFRLCPTTPEITIAAAVFPTLFLERLRFFFLRTNWKQNPSITSPGTVAYPTLA